VLTLLILTSHFVNKFSLCKGKWWKESPGMDELLYTEEQCNGGATFLKHTNQLINMIKVEVNKKSLKLCLNMKYNLS